MSSSAVTPSCGNRASPTLADSGNTLYYRDTKGVVAYVKMLTFRPEPYSNNHRLAIFSLESAVTPATPDKHAARGWGSGER